MRTSNQNDAKSISKLALLASAAATAAFVISEARVLRHLTTPSSPAPAVPPGTPEGWSGEAAHQGESDIAVALGASQTEGPADTTSLGDDAENPGPLPPSGGVRIRFRSRRLASERLRYGLPVRHRQHRTATTAIASRPGIKLSPLAPRVPLPVSPAADDAEFDAEYLAIVEAITHDGHIDGYDADADYLAIVDAIVRDGRPAEEADADEAKPVAEAALLDNSGVTVEEMWWLPAPRLHYIFAALIYVAASAAVGSDPVSLAIEGVSALAAIDSTADLLLLGWVLCGLIVLVPLGAIANRLVLLATRGRLYLPGLVSQDSLDSAGWGLRVLAMSAFVAGAVLYTPHALGWALNTDYPVAAVSSSSMSPGLEEGELVLIDGVASIDQLQVGDIIAFTHEQGVAIRRISGFTNGSAIVRADASPQESLIVPFEDIAGRVLTVAGSQVKLPLLGSIALFGERTVEPD